METETRKPTFKMPLFPYLLLKTLNLTDKIWAKDLVEEITCCVRRERCIFRKNLYTRMGQCGLLAVLDAQIRSVSTDSFRVRAIPAQHLLTFFFLEFIVALVCVRLSLIMSFSSTQEILIEVYESSKNKRSGDDRRISKPYDRLNFGINLCFKKDSSKLFLDEISRENLISILLPEFGKYTFSCKFRFYKVEQKDVLEKVIFQLLRNFKDKAFNSVEISNFTTAIIDQISKEFDVQTIDRRSKLAFVTSKPKLI
jgi:hypothetical protein